jgi:Tol biopolymer transport system component
LVSLLAGGISFVPSAFSPDGRFLVYTVVDPKTQADIWYVPWDAKPDLGKAVIFVATDATESQGQVSPDGKWMAYSSNTTGANEVYVRPFPNGPGGVWKVSVDRGSEPRWSADGKELYYERSLTNERVTLLASAVEADGRGGLRIGAPHHSSTSAHGQSQSNPTSSSIVRTRMDCAFS